MNIARVRTRSRTRRCVCCVCCFIRPRDAHYKLSHLSLITWICLIRFITLKALALKASPEPVLAALALLGGYVEKPRVGRYKPTNIITELYSFALFSLFFHDNILLLLLLLLL